MKVLVTGGAGFIGGHLVDQLVDHGVDVVVLDSIAAHAHAVEPDHLPSSVDLRRADVSDAAAVLHLLRMPDSEERGRYAVALAEELRQFERPMPGMDEYDLLLTAPAGGIQ